MFSSHKVVISGWHTLRVCTWLNVRSWPASEGQILCLWFRTTSLRNRGLQTCCHVLCCRANFATVCFTVYQQSLGGRDWNNNWPVDSHIYWAGRADGPCPSGLVYCCCSVFSLYSSLFQVKTRHSQTALHCRSITSLWCHVLRRDARRGRNGEGRGAGAAPAAVCSWRLHQWVHRSVIS